MTVVAFVIGILAVVIGLAVSIGLHEIGHLLPAKLFKVRVGQYMIGFGKTLWSRKIGETEYGIKLLPLGGYISMAGMYPPAPGQAAQEGTTGVLSQASEQAQVLPARSRFFRTMVQDAQDANEETMAGDTTRTFYALPMWKRIVIMLGGPLMNLVLAVLLFTIVFSGIGVRTATPTLAQVSECVKPATSSSQTCEPNDPRAPGAAAGLRPGDTIIAIDGKKVSTFAEITDIVSASPGKNLSVEVDRDGSTLSLSMTPQLTQRAVVDDLGRDVKNADGSVKTRDVGMIGVIAQAELQRQPFTVGIEQAAANVKAVSGIVVQLPVRVYNTAADMFAGKERDVNGPISIVGVGVLAGQVATTDTPVLNRLAGVLSLLGSLNIALFAFNLLPLLPLDGGHVVVALWDGLRRGLAKLFRRPPPKPVDATKLVPLTFVVVVLLITMTVVLLAADIFNPVKLLN